MALQRRAFPGSSGRHASGAVLWLAALTLALALSVAVPGRSVEPDEAQTEEIRLAQAEPEPPDQPEEPGPDAVVESTEGIEVITVKGAPAIATELPTSLTQFDTQELAALGAQNISELARVTPNLEIKSLTATTPTFFIRGVGLNDFSANAAGAVAIYNDDVPINSPALQVPLLFDIESVGVLRGPQGFDDNRNASAGAIRTRSRKPTGQYEASLRADWGNAPKRAWPNYDSKDFEGVLSAPVVSDWLSARGAFRLSERDPFYKNRCGNLIDPGPDPEQIVCNESPGTGRDDVVPPGLPEYVNDRNRWAARGLLRVQPPESEMDWLLNVHGGVLEEDTQLGQVVGVANGVGGAPGSSSGYTDPDIGELYQKIRQTIPRNGRPAREINRLAREKTLREVARDIELANPFENDYDLVGNEHLESWGTSLRGEFALGPIRATTITATDRYWLRRARDFDFSSNPSIHINSKDEAWQATENLGFEWEPDWFLGTVRWGGYYLREHLDFDGLFHLQLLGVVPVGTFLSYEQEYDSSGVFGNFSWDFLDDFTLEGGVRYNWEHKDFETTALDQARARLGFIATPTELDETWSALTGGISLTYYFTREVHAYGKYMRGWKGGHIQSNSLRNQVNPAGGVTTPVPTVAEPETIDSFEIGARAGWFDDRVQLGGSAFYYRYEDYQVFVIESQFGSFPTLKIINANDARVFGAEADFQFAPVRGWWPSVVEGLTFSGRFSWIESEFLDFSDVRSVAFTLGNGQRILLSTPVDYTGNRLPNTPRFKVSGTVEWPFDFARFGTITLRYDINWTDDSFFDPSNGRGITQNPFFGANALPDYAVGQRAYLLHDARISYRLPNSNVEIAFWGRNLEDKVYKTFVADTTVAFQSLQNLVGEPRTFGGSLAITFF